MEPPSRPTSQKRTAASLNTKPVLPQKYVPEGSPSPFITKPKSTHTSTESRRPRSRSQTVSLGWDEGTDTGGLRTSSLQIELAECVETKTVTTTTTTKRSYPPLLVKQKPLELLNAKDYPLAVKPTPIEFTKISYDVDIPDEDAPVADPSISSQAVCFPYECTFLLITDHLL
jgi:F-box and WD-40 domain protein CDC4